MEIRVNVEDTFMRRLKDLLQIKTPEIVRTALTILSWAAEETKKGRVIVSTDSDGKNIQRLAIPTLEAIRPQETRFSEERMAGMSESKGSVHQPVATQPVATQPVATLVWDYPVFGGGAVAARQGFTDSPFFGIITEADAQAEEWRSKRLAAYLLTGGYD